MNVRSFVLLHQSKLVQFNTHLRDARAKIKDKCRPIVRQAYGINEIIESAPDQPKMVSAIKKKVGVLLDPTGPVNMTFTDDNILVKHVPEWFPGAGFKKKAREWRKLSEAMINEPYEMVKEKVVRILSFPQLYGSC